MQKVALVHDYLIQYGGAEKTLEAIMELFPDAPIYTTFFVKEKFPETFHNKDIRTAKMGKILGLFSHLYKYLTFLLPLYFEHLDLKDYDLIISDSSSYAKGVRTNKNQVHICYIHTPPRFLYGYTTESSKRDFWLIRPIVRIIEHFLRIWDFYAAQRPDLLICNSKEIQARIKKFYRRDSKIIYPPVELSDQTPQDINTILEKNYFLVAGRLARYKNFDLVIKCFNELPEHKLVVLGTGIEEEKLKKIAGRNIEFVGRVDEKTKHELMRNCLGLINPVVDEDFGIVPIEVQSHGRPVLAHKSAGHLETVVENQTGMYFETLSVEELKQKILEFEKYIKENRYYPQTIKESVKKFSKERFKEEFTETVCQNCQK